MLRFYHDLLSFFLLMWLNFRVLEVLSVYVRRLASNIAGKLGNAYLRNQYRQPATCFPLTATLAMLAIAVLPVKYGKRPWSLHHTLFADEVVFQMRPQKPKSHVTDSLAR